MHLTKDELQRFLAVVTNGKATQQAFGFALFTGLRLSDIQSLTWKDVRLMGDSRFIYITQKKTDEQLVIPLGKMAQQYLPERPNEATRDDIVFRLPTRNAILLSCKWIAKKRTSIKMLASITSRHTFAMLALESSKDIEMVSKLLGHKSVLTTQIYAEVQMISKMGAVSNLDGILGQTKSVI